MEKGSVSDSGLSPDPLASCRRERGLHGRLPPPPPRRPRVSRLPGMMEGWSAGRQAGGTQAEGQSYVPGESLFVRVGLSLGKAVEWKRRTRVHAEPTSMGPRAGSVRTNSRQFQSG